MYRSILGIRASLAGKALGIPTKSTQVPFLVPENRQGWSGNRIDSYSTSSSVVLDNFVSSIALLENPPSRSAHRQRQRRPNENRFFGPRRTIVLPILYDSLRGCRLSLTLWNLCCFLRAKSSGWMPQKRQVLSNASYKAHEIIRCQKCIPSGQL